MARARTGGGLAVAMVFFIILFFFALVLAVIFYNGKSKSDAELATAQKQQAQDRAALTQATEENTQLKGMISSQPDLTLEALGQQREQRDISQALFDEVDRLNRELSAAQSATKQAEQARDEARTQAAAAEQSKAALDKSYNDTIAELRTQIDKVSQDFEQYRNDIRGSDDKLSTELADLRREKDQRIADQEQTLRQKDADVVRMRSEIERLTGGQKGSTGGVENVVVADGHVTATADNLDQVYINLGSNDHITLGLTFEVFNAMDLIKTDEFQDVRGKATVEVISVEPATSLARIVRKGYKAIVKEGDQIVNMVYDPKKSFKFHIYGDFDINHDGQATEAERQLVESMVRRWGGQLTPDLTYEDDYLVLGIEPPLPEALPQDVIDPVLIAKNVEAKKNYEQYQTLIGEARSLTIPVLNQNRFLALVGYYDR
ncbi:MAG: hypothetical protein IT445_19200 [Phycisphaeraceae bacterium]|nr:hypothetical protein [Phycisphaeraceae bacterium]